LTIAADLAGLGFLSEAAMEADWYVQRHAGDAGIAALPLFMAGARRIYLALMLRRGRQWEMLEVAEG